MRQALIGSLFFLTLLWAACGDKTEQPASAEPEANAVITRVIDTSEGNCDDSLGCVTIDISYDVLTSSHDSPARKTINARIEELALMSGVDTSDTTVDRDIVTSTFASYRQLREDFPEYHLPWELTRSVRLVTERCGLLSYRYENFEFTGGAHPNSEERLINFISATGDLLSLDSLLIPNGRESLDEIGERYFRRARKFDPDSTLGSAGFWFDLEMFHLNDNFLVEDSGLTFVFNRYEIAPYVYGATELFFPFDSIRQLVRIDCLTD